jgi:hypothetical protein
MELREFGCHVPGQEFLDPAEGMVGDAGKRFAQPAFRLDTVQLRRAQQRVDGSRALAASVRSTEEIVFAAQSDSPDILPMSVRN